MGHHFSKPIVRANSQDQSHLPISNPASPAAAVVEAISLDEELQVEEILSEAVAAASPSEVRQIIIKIQLAKMEQQVEEQEKQVAAAALSADALNANGQRIVNVTLESGDEVATAEVGVVANRTAGSSAEGPKNNNFAGSVGAAISTLNDANSNCHEEQPIAAVGDGESREGNDDVDEGDDDANDDDDVVDESLLRRNHNHRHSHIHEAEVVEYCEVLESLPVTNMLSSATQHTSKQGGQKSKINSKKAEVLKLMHSENNQ